MTREIVSTAGMTYTVAPDAHATRRRSMSTIVEARLIDELTLRPIDVPVRLQPAGTGFSSDARKNAVRPRVAGGGLVALVGVPADVVSDIAGPAVEYGMAVEADGYLAVTRTRLFDASATLPNNFAAFDLGDIALHRASVTVAGRVTRRSTTGDTQPLSGATITVAGIWHAPLPATGTAPPSPANVIALQTPLSADRTAGIDSVQRCTVLSSLGQTARLARAAASGDRVLNLTDRIGLTANATIAVDPTNADSREWVVIASVDGTLPDTLAGTVTLQHPLDRAHAAGTSVASCTVQLVGTPESLALDALAGDSLLLLGGTAGLTVSSVVEITGSTAREYRAASPLTATTVNGFYRLPAIHRLVQVRIRVESGVLPPILENVSLDYSVREQRIDFTFP
jgi:hypothetical protein